MGSIFTYSSMRMDSYATLKFVDYTRFHVELTAVDWTKFVCSKIIVLGSKLYVGKQKAASNDKIKNQASSLHTRSIVNRYLHMTN